MPPEFDVLAPSTCIDSDHPSVRRLASRLTQNTSHISEKARNLFTYVRNRIRYDLHSPFHLLEHYLASRTLSRGSGYCVQKAVLLAALARATGIAARLVFADIKNHLVFEPAKNLLGSNLFVYHCYVEMHIGSNWVQTVPSFDPRLCNRHGYPLVEFDGVHDALFPKTDAQGRRFIEYLRIHGRYNDVPLDEILASWQSAYGVKTVERLKLLSHEIPTHTDGSILPAKNS